MTEPAKKSGAFQIWASAALLLLMMAPAIYVISDETGDGVAALRNDGLVTEARVTGKRKVEEPYTDSKGRSKSTTAAFIDLEYDSQTSMSYAEWLANGEEAPAPAPGVGMNTYAYRSTNAEYDAVKEGDRVPVVIGRYERTRADLASFVKTYSNRMTQLAAMLIGLLGAISAIMGWRSRKSG